MLDKTLLHYEILRKLGEGGMGEVYLALDTKLGREVALKILPPEVASDPERLERFRREATAVAALNHPNIVTIYSVEETDGLHFFAMEHVDGLTLSKVIPERGLPLPEFLDLAIPIANALSAAHQRGVTHRDLKPGNIMVGGDGRVKVLDFGLAKVQTKDSGGSGSESHLETEYHTSDGQVLGTTPYMSPEQLKGHVVDHRSDVYSMGVVLYIMATGRHPHLAGSTAEVISGILGAKAPPVNQVNPHHPERLGRCIDLCLEKDPSYRFSSASEVYHELEGLRADVDHGRVVVGPSTARSPIRAPSKQHLLRWGLTGLAVLALVAAGFLFSRMNLSSTPELRSLAVLPFANLTGDTTLDHLSEAVSAGLMNRLREVEGLQVAGRADAWSRRERSLSELESDLGVGAVVDGDIQRSGRELRYTVNLTDLSTGFVLWSHPYTIPEDGTIYLQNTIARDLAVFLSIPLSPEDRRRVARERDGPHLAFDYFVNGQRYLDGKEDQRGPDAAAENFRQALRIDPDFALAHVGLSEALWQIHRRDADRDALSAAETEAEIARSIDPSLPAARVALARVYRTSGRQDAAINEIRAALAQHPRPDEAYRELARSYERVGDAKEAEDALRSAAALRPEDWFNQVTLGTFLCKHGSYDEGRRILERSAELAPPDVVLPHERLATFDLMMGRFEEAITAYELIVNAAQNPRIAANLGTAYYYSDRPDKWTNAEKYYLLAVRMNPKDSVYQANLGDLYRQLGRDDEAHQRYLEARELVAIRAQDDPDNPVLLFERADYSAKAEDCKTALSLASELRELLPDTGPNAHQLAFIYATCGDDEAAMVAIRRAIDLGEPAELIRKEEEFHRLHDRPDFAALVGAADRKF